MPRWIRELQRLAYPGTPATEIMEYLQECISNTDNDESIGARDFRPVAQWCTNEKTAYESALGVSFAGRRTMVSMKHVGLNVAMDPFVNSALVRINGGLVCHSGRRSRYAFQPK